MKTWPPCSSSLMTELSRLPVNSQLPWLEEVGTGRVWLIRNEWIASARLAQYPLLDGSPDTWLLLGGRGAGKTRTGAEWVNGLVRGFSPFAGHKYARLALIGETMADVRDVMIEGISGIATISRGDRPRFEASRRRLIWKDGQTALMFSSEDPESLRGHQFEAAWCDEVAKWRHAEDCFDMLQFGLRLGERPLQLLTTTPRPTRLLKRLLADPAVVKEHITTQENSANLATSFLAAVERRYAGTVLGRQELDGELIEDRADALWSREMLDKAATGAAGELRRIVVAIDPPASSRKTSDACGIVAAGLDGAGRAVVLADATLRGAKPQRWASQAVALFHSLQADCLLVEVNQGGEMATAVIRTVDPFVPIKAVRARRGKWLRAEPVASLYQQGRVLHAGRFAELEDEMCDFGPDGLSNGRSPDRVDALVWAVSELMPDHAAEPRIRELR